MASRRLRADDFHRPYVELLDRTAILQHEDGYRRIRARQQELKEWFADRTGWFMVVTRHLARLVKEPALHTPGHGFSWVQAPSDYELFAWLLWYAEGIGDDRPFLLTEMVEEVADHAAVDFNRWDERLSLARALGGLQEIGALDRLDGDVESWVQNRQGEGLYEFTDLALRLVWHLQPEVVEALGGGGTANRAGAWTGIGSESGDGIRDEHPGAWTGSAEADQPSAGAGPGSSAGPAAMPGTAPDPQRHGRLEELAFAPDMTRQVARDKRASSQTQARHRLYRILLLEPVLYAADDPEAFSLLNDRGRQDSIRQDLERAFGWDLEVTAHYAVLWRPAGAENSEGAVFPFGGSLPQVMVLFCGQARDLVIETGSQLTPDENGEIRLTLGQMELLVDRLRATYVHRWGVGRLRQPSAPLTEELARELKRWGMLAGPDADGYLRILPLAARFAGSYPAAANPTTTDYGATGSQEEVAE